MSMPWGELAFLFMAAGAAVYSYRTLPVAVAIVTPILAAAVAPSSRRSPYDAGRSSPLPERWSVA